MAVNLVTAALSNLRLMDGGGDAVVAYVSAGMNAS
jgi:hypothetical protein